MDQEGVELCAYMQGRRREVEDLIDISSREKIKKVVHNKEEGEEEDEREEDGDEGAEGGRRVRRAGWPGSID